ncbi:MAG: leucine-rich repeat protein [Clostridia bacterium]|nr:leucine-rich repeat protein [Clostridia bacterium]
MINIIDFDNRIFLVEDGKALLSVKKDNIVSFDDCINVIGSSFMEGDLSIEGIIVSDNIVEICENAFYNCTNLKFVVLGKKLNRIGQCAFTNNTALRYVIFNGAKEEYVKILQGEPFEKIGIIHCTNGIVRTVNAK